MFPGLRLRTPRVSIVGITFFQAKKYPLNGGPAVAVDLLGAHGSGCGVRKPLGAILPTAHLRPVVAPVEFGTGQRSRISVFQRDQLVSDECRFSDPPDLLAALQCFALHVVPEPKSFVLVINVVLDHGASRLSEAPS